MSSLRDQVLLTIAIVALALSAFLGGWWMGRVGSALDGQDARIAALEQRLALAGAGRVERPEPAAAARREPAAPPVRVEVAVGDAPVRGPADAPVTFVAFSDFECPFWIASSPRRRPSTRRACARTRRRSGSTSPPTTRPWRHPRPRRASAPI